jgi:hypothetical protein
VESRTKALRLKRARIECYEPTREQAMAALDAVAATDKYGLRAEDVAAQRRSTGMPAAP